MELFCIIISFYWNKLEFVDLFKLNTYGGLYIVIVLSKFSCILLFEALK